MIKNLLLEIYPGVTQRIEVSDKGNVYICGIPKAASDNGNGYKSICVTKTQGGVQRSKRFYIHRLVAEAFLGDPSGLQVNHKNFNRADNTLKNLEIVTSKENHKHKNDRWVPMSGVEYANILWLHYDFRMSALKISKEVGISRCLVRKALRGDFNSKFSWLTGVGPAVGILYRRT